MVEKPTREIGVCDALATEMGTGPARDFRRRIDEPAMSG